MTSQLVLGGLFSGVGGFELAWQRLGGRVAWMCEIDKKAQQVLRARFPGVPIYDDVTRLDPSEVEAVDVLTGGSPCQGFSVAGSRSGLEHGESRLFADYIRIMDGLAARGLQFALWENVPGVLSIKNDDGERTFEHVVSALAGVGEPVRFDPKHKWNVGMAVRPEEGSGDGRAVAWRVLDSRYFGVAQRRRRIFACVAFGNSAASRAGRTLLAVSEGLRRDSDAGEPSWQEPAGAVTESVGVEGIGRVMRKVRSDDFVSDETSSTLAARDHKDFGDLVVESQPFRKSARVSTADSAETWVDDGLANTLNAFDVGDVRTTHAIVETASYGVRRLTPVECERLQAFPDGWTEPAGSDSARYKAMGNAVTVNVVQWVLSRMIPNMKQEGE